MEVFKRITTLELKLFIRRYYLIVPLVLTYLYMFYGYKIMQDRLDEFLFIRTSGFVMMLLITLSMCSGIINARQEKDCKFDELINTLPGFWIRHMAKIFTWSLCAFVYCSILVILCVIWCTNRTNGIGKYICQITPYIFVNFGIPMVSVWIIAYSVEKIFKPKIGWPFLLLIWYFISPLRNDLSNITIFLNQFVEEAHGNSRLIHYGLEMNIGLISRKLWFLLFSLFGYITANLYYSGSGLIKNTKAKIALTTAILLFVGAVPLAVVSSRPHSQGVLWELENDVWNGELLKQAKEKHELETTNGQINLLSLEIGSNKGDLLEYSARINIDNVTKEPIVLTLYRSLGIREVKVNGLDYTEYMRERDWIIFQKHPEGKVEIEINVSGRLPYSLAEITDRTMVLMPDFPWYPILGKHKVLNPILNYDYLPNNLAKEKPYNIVLKSHRGNIITNLSDDTATEFNGQATGPAIIQGDFISKTINDIHFVAPSSLYYFYKQDIAIVTDLLQEYKRKFADSLGIELGYDSYSKYNQVFLVNLRNPIRINRDEVYLDYSAWVTPPFLDNEADSIRTNCENLRLMLAFECFWRTGVYVESSIQPCLFTTMIEIAESGEKRDLEEYFTDWRGKGDENQIIWENDNKDMYEIEKLIKAESKDEISKIAYQILNKWVTINKSSKTVNSSDRSVMSDR